MKVLVFTNMYPTEESPYYGSFVFREVRSLRDAGIDVDVYFVNGKANKLNYLAMPFGFFKRLLTGKYDIVHVHHSFCGFVATWQTEVPVIWTFHEGEISSDAETRERDEPVKKLAYSRNFKRRVANKVKQMIVVAGHLKESLQRPDAIVIPSGVDMELFQPYNTAKCKEQLKLDPAARYILFPSSPDRIEKRYELARAAVDLLRSDHGTGTVELLCLDQVPHDQVPVFMGASELMLMTSSFEASPITVREALACNVPVISTDVGDTRTLLEPIGGCHIVEPRAENIASVLATALSATRRIPTRDLMKKYSLGATAKRLIQIYHGVSGV